MMVLPAGNYRNNPPGMLGHLRKVDLFKTLAHKLSRETRGLFRQFADTLALGTHAVDFTLQTVSGETLSLSDYRGKRHVVLEFGSFT